jgi:phage baseplate assembly protein W
VANLINLYQYEVPYARLKGMDPSIIDSPTEDAEIAVKNHASVLIENYEPRVTVNDIGISYTEDNRMIITPDITVNEV